jgi:hypothetical protein
MESFLEVKLFVWKCLKDLVPTGDKLARYGNDIELHCSFRSSILSWFSAGNNITFGVGIPRNEINQ